MLSKLLVLASLASISMPCAGEFAGAWVSLTANDECLAGGEQDCALRAQQLRAGHAGGGGNGTLADQGALATGMDRRSVWRRHRARTFGGWRVGHSIVWGRGQGIESINPMNLDYFDRGMNVARGQCSSADCALVINPPEARTVNETHIHFFRYEDYGENLKGKLEAAVCEREGWHHSRSFPCDGKAIFVSGWPSIFSTALEAGGLSHASVIAWPASCGGAGTIVQMAYGCSIEHQLRGDFDPSKR